MAGHHRPLRRWPGWYGRAASSRRGSAGRRPRLGWRGFGRHRRGARRVARRRQFIGLHLNYGLRPDSDGDQRTCEELCRALGIELEVERPRLGEGNVQAEARRARYAAAERVRALARARLDRHRAHQDRPRRDRHLQAGHVARASRAAWVSERRRGHVIRPMLSLERDEARELVAAGRVALRRRSHQRRARSSRVTGFATRCSPSCARSARRPTPRSPRPRRSSPRRARRSTGSRLRRCRPPGRGARGDRPRRVGGAGSGDPPPRAAAAGGASVRRAGRPSGGRGPRRSGGWRTSPRAAWSSLAAASRRTPSTGTSGSSRAPGRTGEGRLAVPGVCRFGAWEVRAELRERRAGSRRPGPRCPRPGGARTRGHGAELEGRATGCGLSASTGLSRFRTCSRTARCRARCVVALPVVEAGERIAWIAGVAVSEEFAAKPGATESARPAGHRSAPAHIDSAPWKPTTRSGRCSSPKRTCSAGSPSSAREVSRDYEGRPPLLVAILKGAVPFLADLMRHLEIDCELDFMAVSSYGSSTDSSGVVRILKDLDAPIVDRDVLIVEDIIDSGLTLHYLLAQPAGEGPEVDRGLRPADQAGATAGGSAGSLRRLRDPERVRDRLWTRPRASATATSPTWPHCGKTLKTAEATLVLSR